MNVFFVIAAVLAVTVGILHSWLGERYILIRLFRRRDLPRLFGDDWFTRRTLRFAWHATSLAWWGFAALLFGLARVSPLDDPLRATACVIAWTFLASSVLALIASRGRHLSWILFLGIAVAVWLGLRG